MAAYLNNRVRPEDVKTVIEIGKRRFDCIEPHLQFSVRGEMDSPDDVPRSPQGWNPANDKAPRADTVMPEGKVPVPEAFCPEGTVPIQKFDLDELAKYPTLEAWLNRRRSSPDDPGAAGPNEYAARRQFVANYGFEAYLNVWDPFVQTGQSEFSLAQLWVVGCNLSGQACTGSSKQTVEAGWIDYPNSPEPGLGDGGAELFIFTTSDNYSTLCWNTECDQWVQSGGITPGTGFTPVSSTNGDQYEIPMFWYRDTAAPNHWWLRYGGTWLGYYKNNDDWFDEPGLQDNADYYTIGGEIVNNATAGHTPTDMGSGECPSSFTPETIYRRAAFIRNIQYVTTGNAFATPSFAATFETAPYDLGGVNPHGAGTNWLTHFYHGGPGDSACP
jgi:hypothetical protein